MIKKNAFGYEVQVKELISNAMLNMTNQQVESWMQHQFDPSSMFIHIDDDRVTSCLQVKHNVFHFNKKKCTVSCFVMACTLPDYRQRGYFSELLDAALNQSINNDLISMIYTNFPKLFESRSFLPVSKTYNYWIPSHKCTYGSDKKIKTYHPSMDLYSVYTSFLSHFDGSIKYNEKEFDAFIQYQMDAGKRIVAMMQEEAIAGFAIYRVVNLNVQLDYIIYLNPQAILDIFKYFGLRYLGVSFTISEYERFEKILDIDYPRKNGTILARCNNYKLFSKWCGSDVRNATQIFDLLEIPSWNHFM